MGKFSVVFLIIFFSSCSFPKIDVSKKLQVDSLTLVFSGDLMQHLPQVAAAKSGQGYDYHSCFSSISRLWQSVDFAIVNLETTLSATPPYSGYPMFCSPSSVLDAIKTAGIDVVALANNHICDKGKNGLSKTLQELENKGFIYTGATVDSCRNYTILEANRLRIGLLNYTYGTNGMPVPKGFKVNLIDTLCLSNTLSELRKESVNKVIVFYHWGIEYQIKENIEQQKLAKWSLENGVDFVVGSHPHVAQPIDTAKKIVYSLGNLVSNQSNRYQDGGISVKLTIFRDSIRCQFVPHWVDRADRYKILLPLDTLVNNSEVFRRSLRDNRDIVGNVNELVL